MIKRYNQSFGKFGYMQQNSDGKWIKHEDYESIEKNLKCSIESSNLRNQEYHRQLDDLWTELHKTVEDSMYWQICAFFEGIVIMILGILLFVQ